MKNFSSWSICKIFNTFYNVWRYKNKRNICNSYARRWVVVTSRASLLFVTRHRLCQWLGSYISSIDVSNSPSVFLLQRKSLRKDILDARCYWSRKQEQLIKARSCIVVVVTCTREWLDSKNRRQNRPFSIMLCILISVSTLGNAIRNNYICTRLFFLFHNGDLCVFSLLVSMLCVLWFVIYVFLSIVALFLHRNTNNDLFSS
jgi:hypothetical protein